ncbi:CapA family protein [Cellulomonas endophytica]|uniref:CapA family protein n=1 Tax=Cellulomonas endophytica TaxID=2494735 RepID=UPI001012CDE5|nr:CapA family protein [Cellulomonas endophytica]
MVPRPRRAGVVVGLLAVLVVLVVAVAVLALRTAGAADVATPGAPSGGGSGTVDGTGSPGATPSATAPTPAPAPAPEPVPEPDATVTIVAAGDVLPHEPVLASATAPDGTVDFSPLLAPLDPWVRGADLALCHLEVPVAPPGVAPTGYPLFGAPAALVGDLAQAGWDGCSTASNHAVDRGAAGVTATLDALDAAGLGHVGTARSAAEAALPQLYRVEDAGRTITVAHLAATYGTNGMPVAAPWSVDRIDVPALVAAAGAARAGGADLVVVSLHCCVEYRTEPAPEQRAAARELAGSGVVDLVLGHHAHVPQPVERLPGGVDGTGMWVAYGLGNLVSNQDAECCVPETSSGLLLTATVRATGADPATGTPAGPPRVVGVTWTGVTVDRHGGHRVHALADLTAGTPTLPVPEVQDRRARVAAAVGTTAPEATSPPDPFADGTRARVEAVPRPAAP